MKTTKLLTIISIMLFFSNCTNNKNKELEELRLENEQLRKEVFQESQTVYTWTVIHCKQGTYTWSQYYERLENVKEHTYWSEIEMIYNFNEDVKY